VIVCRCSSGLTSPKLFSTDTGGSATFTTLVARAFGTRSTTNRTATNRFRPRVEGLEVREVPATYIWVGEFSTDADTAANWRNEFEPGPSSTLPGDGDTVIFGAGDVGGDVDCVGFGLAGGYSFAIVHVSYGYSQTVTLDEGFTTEDFLMTSGAISQPGSGTDITVTDEFEWTDGVLNSSDYPATVYFDGATGTINPSAAAAATLTSGSHLNLVYAAALTINPGTLNLDNGTGIEANNLCSIQLNAQAQGVQADVTLRGRNGTFSSANGRQLRLNTGSTLLVQGPGSWTNDKLALSVQGGHARVEGSTQGEVKSPDLTIQHPITISSGELWLQKGSRIKVDQHGVLLAGGFFGAYSNNTTPGEAVIDGKFDFRGGEVRFWGDQKVVLKVTDNVKWEGGFFRPRVDVTVNGASDTWEILGTLTIPAPPAGQQSAAKLAPVSLNYNPALGVNSAYRWTVLRIHSAVTGGPHLVTDGPAYARFTSGGSGVPNDPTNWLLGVP
jgi:hypothetical protein